MFKMEIFQCTGSPSTFPKVKRNFHNVNIIGAHTLSVDIHNYDDVLIKRTEQYKEHPINLSPITKPLD